jgi:hypothetical protein
MPTNITSEQRAEWLADIDDALLKLTNDSDFYLEAKHYLPRIHNNEYEAYRKLRDIALYKLRFNGVWGRAGEKRRILLTALMEEINAYYFEGLKSRLINSSDLISIRCSYKDWVQRDINWLELNLWITPKEEPEELKVGDSVLLRKTMTAVNPDTGHSFVILPRMLKDGSYVIKRIDHMNRIYLVGCGEGFTYHKDWLTKVDQPTQQNNAQHAVEETLRNYLSGSPALQLNITTQESNMSLGTTPVVVTKTFINNLEAESVTDDQIFELISRTELEIDRLEKTKTKPAKLKARIEAMKEDVKALVKLVDERE